MASSTQLKTPVDLPPNASIDKKATSESGGWRACVGPVIVTLAATSIALAYHFVYGHTKSALIYDARNYLWTSAQISQFLIDLSHLKWCPELVTNPQFRDRLFNDGPVYTTFIGSFFALLQHAPVQKDWVKVEVIQSILHGLTTALVFDLARRMVRSGDTGLTEQVTARVSTIAGYSAALIWALYPAANIATGFLYTEPLVVFVISLFVWASSSSSPTIKANLLAGCAGGLLFLIKPVLAPAALVGCLLRAVLSQKRIKSLSTIAVGMALTILPWSLYTHFVCGNIQVTTARFATYNVVLGSDLEADGRLSIPRTPLTNFFRSDESPFYFVASQWQRQPLASLQMVARKVTRLLTYEWNDFRHAYFGLTAPQQRWLHLLLVYLGLAGAMYAICTRKMESASKPVVLALSMMWMPMIYLLFEANSRYGFTIMPMYAAFAGLYLSYVFSRQGKKPLIVLSAVLALGTLITFFNIGDWACTGASKETHTTIEPNQTLVTGIDLSKISQPKSNYEPLILVDGERSIESANIEVNGHAIGQLKGLRYFDSRLYDGYYVTKELASAMNVSPFEFRQWRLARVPKELINWNGTNEIKITAHEPATIYGDTARRVETLPSLRHFCPNQLFNSPEGLDTRSPLLLRPSQKTYQFSRLVGASNNLDGSTRVRIALVMESPRKRKQILPLSDYAMSSASADSKMRAVMDEQINPDRFPFIMRSSTGDDTVRTNRFIVANTAPLIEIQLPEPISQENRLKIKLTGEAKAASTGLASAVITNGRFAVLSTNPTAFSVGPDWKQFTLEDIMPLVLLHKKEGGYALTVALYPGPWIDETGYGSSRKSSDTVFRNLKLSVSYAKELDLSGRQVFVY
ncbi:MAG: glycosyltransferase family 39 protein [Candidatus Obscuribacterales bacterium]|nr:glycosyltransferase family 39 protein [Candidatus Obscuribacterales bacterium]